MDNVSKLSQDTIHRSEAYYFQRTESIWLRDGNIGVWRVSSGILI